MADYTLTQSGAQIQADLNLTENLQDAFSTSATYAVGDLAIYNSGIWKCHTAVSTAGAWTGSTNWTQIQLGDLSKFPEVVISLNQVVSQDPIIVQLTNSQYDVFVNNKEVLIDLSALGKLSVVWQFGHDDGDIISFGFLGIGAVQELDRIDISKSTKRATYSVFGQQIEPGSVGSGGDVDAGKLLKMNSEGWGVLSDGLPYLTTAPSAANTDGIKIVVLSSQPSILYNGYLYLVLGS